MGITKRVRKEAHSLMKKRQKYKAKLIEVCHSIPFNEVFESPVVHIGLANLLIRYSHMHGSQNMAQPFPLTGAQT